MSTVKRLNVDKLNLRVRRRSNHIKNSGNGIESSRIFQNNIISNKKRISSASFLLELSSHVKSMMIFDSVLGANETNWVPTIVGMMSGKLEKLLILKGSFSSILSNKHIEMLEEVMENIQRVVYQIKKVEKNSKKLEVFSNCHRSARRFGSKPPAISTKSSVTRTTITKCQ